MPFSVPAEVLRHLPTPCLLVDVPACERNIALAGHHCSGTAAKLRPHFKAHKCTQLLRRQLAAGGCIGVTCATAFESEVLAQSGFADILVANQVVDEVSLSSLGRAARQSTITVAIDDHEHVELLARQAGADAISFGVLIEVDVGMNRCGIDPGTGQLLSLAAAIDAHERLTLRGIQAYEGHAMLLEDPAERREHVRRASDILVAERQRLLDTGHACDVLAGGGTGTFELVTEADVWTEVQAGSYVLMDATYARLGLPFENALYAVATVLSHARPGSATLNAGLKSLSAELGLPAAIHPGLDIRGLADEHTLVSVSESTTLRVGEHVLLVPSHIDPTINLHDILFAWDERSARLEHWPIDGRRRHADAPTQARVRPARSLDDQ